MRKHHIWDWTFMMPLKQFQRLLQVSKIKCIHISFYSANRNRIPIMIKTNTSTCVWKNQVFNNLLRLEYVIKYHLLVFAHTPHQHVVHRTKCDPRASFVMLILKLMEQFAHGDVPDCNRAIIVSRTKLEFFQVWKLQICAFVAVQIELLFKGRVFT